LEDGDPQLEIVALQPPHAPAVDSIEGTQITVLHSNEIRFIDRKISMEVDETNQCGGSIVGFSYYLATAFKELLADVYQYSSQNCSLAREMLIDRRTTGPASIADVFD
jgi:hypothetical protein